MKKEKPKISRKILKSQKIKPEPLILEVMEKIGNHRRRLVGYQQYNPKTGGFIFHFADSYPKGLRKKKEAEILSLAEVIGVDLKIK